MKRINKLVMTLLISALFLACSDDSAVAPVEIENRNRVEPSLKVIHSSYNTPAVDIWVNDVKEIENLVYGESSALTNLQAGNYNIKVVPSGSTSPVVIEANLILEKNKDYTVVAAGRLEEIEPVVIVNQKMESQKSLVRFIHSSPDAPAVDIKVDDGTGKTIFANTSFRGFNSYIAVDPGVYNLAVTPSGSEKEVAIYGNVNLMSGGIYTVNAMGTLNSDDEVPFLARTYIDEFPFAQRPNSAYEKGNSFIDLAPATSNVKVAHASPDAPAVDLYINGELAGSGLSFPAFTEYLKINSGTSNVKVTAAGTQAAVIEGDIRFNAYKNYSIYAVDQAANIAPLIIEDNLEAPAAGKAHVRFLHLSPDAPAVDITLPDGTVIFGNMKFKEYSEFTPLNAGMYDLQVRLAGTSTVVLELNGVNLQGGNIYSVFAKGFVAGSGDKSLGAQIIVNNQLLNNN